MLCCHKQALAADVDFADVELGSGPFIASGQDSQIS